MLASPEAIERYLGRSRDARWFSNFGPCARLLSDRLTESAGRPCVLVANATLGLIAALAAVSADREGAEVLVPSFAFAASAQAAAWNRLRPVFVDVHPGHWHLDPDRLDEALAARPGRVAVVVALSSFGVPPPPDVRRRWEQSCAGAGVPLVVDSAAGYGAVAEDGIPIGGQGDVEVVSFHALKPLSSGEGGAVFCRDAAVAERITHLINFAFDDEHQATELLALNAKLSEPAAAIGLASLDELPDALAARREHAEAIVHRLPRGITYQSGGHLGTWQFVPTALDDPDARAAILAEAGRRDVALRTYYDPLHWMPAFTACERADELVVTEDLGRRMLSLPMAVDLDEGAIAEIADLVEQGLRSALRA